MLASLLACCFTQARRGPQLIVSGSDDGTAKVRFIGVRVYAQTYQIWNGIASDGYHFGTASAKCTSAANVGRPWDQTLITKI